MSGATGTLDGVSVRAPGYDGRTHVEERQDRAHGGERRERPVGLELAPAVAAVTQRAVRRRAAATQRDARVRQADGPVLVGHVATAVVSLPTIVPFYATNYGRRTDRGRGRRTAGRHSGAEPNGRHGSRASVPREDPETSSFPTIAVGTGTRPGGHLPKSSS